MFMLLLDILLVIQRVILKLFYQFLRMVGSWQSSILIVHYWLGLMLKTKLVWSELRQRWKICVGMGNVLVIEYGAFIIGS